MTLAEVLGNIELADRGLTVYAEKNPEWSPSSRAILARELEDGAAPRAAEGLEYVLEVFVVHDVLEVWSAWRGGRIPNVREKCEAVIHYAENDSYLPVE